MEEEEEEDVTSRGVAVLPLVITYVQQVAQTVLGLDAAACSAATSSNTSEGGESLKVFVEDRGVAMLLLVGHRSSSGVSHLEIRGGSGMDWRGGEDGSNAMMLVKRAESLTSKQPISQQIQVISLGTSLVDSLHAHVKSSFVPLLESFFSPSTSGGLNRSSHQHGEAVGVRERGANASASLLVRKKVSLDSPHQACGHSTEQKSKKVLNLPSSRGFCFIHAGFVSRPATLMFIRCPGCRTRAGAKGMSGGCENPRPFTQGASSARHYEAGCRSCRAG